MNTESARSMLMATFISHSPAETEALGVEWGRAASRGWVIGLSGDLGAGKTQLVKGIARGLGVEGRVHSPTFALLNEYHGGRLPLFHVDLYRLETREQIVGAGLENYFYNPPGVAVIEWIERWDAADLQQPKSVEGLIYRSVKIEVINETDRHVIYEDFGR